MASTFRIFQEGYVEPTIDLEIILTKRLADPDTSVQVEGAANIGTERYFFRVNYFSGQQTRNRYFDLPKTYLSQIGKTFSIDIQLVILDGVNVTYDNKLRSEVSSEFVIEHNKIYVGYD